MECWYKNCTHSSTNCKCEFRVMPSNSCQQKIWMRYASIPRLPKSRTAVICSCHFNETSENPIPYFEDSRKRQECDSYLVLQPKIKHSKITIDDEVYLNNIENDVNDIDLSIFKDERNLLHAQYLDNEQANDVLYQDYEYLLDEGIDNNFEEMKIFNIVEFEELLLPPESTDSMNKRSHDSRITATVEDELKKWKKENEEIKLKIDELENRLAVSQTFQKENEKIKLQNYELMSRLAEMNSSFGFESIENSDKKIFAHTGLPSREVFNIVFNTLSKLEFKYVCGWNPTKISMKNQLLMTLMKLRMDLRNFDLAERFKCSVATVSNIVRTWILAMHEVFFLQLMKDIPSRRPNKDSMPIAFKEFSACRIVLDCSEMFSDKPKRMNQQKDVYSPYKHHVTFKPLIGAAPNGVMTYASRFYPGSTSDKKIVEHCGIIKQLNVGDIVLADKGFLVKDVLPNGVHLNVPPFLTTPQFTREQVRRTELIARARIHIERGINRIKNFRILKYIPSEMFYISSEVFQVCVALTNFQYPLIREIEKTL